MLTTRYVYSNRGFKAFSVISQYTFKRPCSNLEDQLQNLSMPITILYGESSDWYNMSKKSLQGLEEKVTIKVHVFPGTGHHMQVQMPEEIVQFIQKSVLEVNSMSLSEIDGPQVPPEMDHTVVVE